MKIVILNECFFNDEHLQVLQKIGDVTIYDDTDTEEKAIARMKDADIVIGDQFIVKFNQRVLESSKKLKFLALNTISFAYVDLKTAKMKGIRIANVPGFSKQAVAEFVIGLLFAVNRKIALADRLMHTHSFELDPGNKDHQRFIGFELKGKTLGIIGLGTIGTVVAQLGHALGMKVVAFNRTLKKVKNVKMLILNDVLKKSDVISIHLALNEDTREFISAKDFNLMKKNAIFINTTQPEIVNTEALYNALTSGIIAGAAIDAGTMINNNHPLFRLENVVLTPHAGSFTQEAFFEALPAMIVNNVVSFVSGKPINIVNDIF